MKRAKMVKSIYKNAITSESKILQQFDANSSLLKMKRRGFLK
jgi:hypothetical protein